MRAAAIILAFVASTRAWTCSTPHHLRTGTLQLAGSRASRYDARGQSRCSWQLSGMTSGDQTAVNHGPTVNPHKGGYEPDLHTESSYACWVIEKWLEDHSFKYGYRNPHVGLFWRNHGLGVRVSHDITLSIQTHSMITMGAFAETMIVHMGHRDQDEIADKELGYRNPDQRFETPEKLFEHILAVLAKYTEPK